MSIDRAGTQNLNQKQASQPLANETEKQINPSVKFNPRQESRETSEKVELGSRSAQTPKTLEDAPSVESTRGGL